MINWKRWYHRGAGLVLGTSLVLLAQVAGAFSYYKPGPQGTVGISRPTIAQQLSLKTGEQIIRAQMWVDGAKVQPTWTQTGLVSYTPPAALQPGSHAVKLSVEVAPAQQGYVFDPLVSQFTFVVGDGALDVLPSPGSEERRALEQVNFYRLGAGLPAMTYADSLGAAAQGHAKYLVANPSQRQNDPHHQRFPSPLYFGETGGQRAEYFGYSSGSSEVINFVDRAEEAVDGWMETLYHRIPLIHPGNHQLGYGRAGGGEALVNVAEAGPGDETPGQTAWPYPGQTGVPTGWDGAEMPDPFRLYPGAAMPVGYTVTLTFGGAPRELRLETGTLTGPQGLVKVMKFHPGNDSHLTDTVALIPAAPLEPSTTYTVFLAGTVDLGTGRQPFEKRWSFTTAPNHVPLMQRRSSYRRGDGSLDRVVVEGEGFTSGMKVFLGDLPVETLRVESSNRLTFAPPVGYGGGEADLLVVSPDGKEAIWRSIFTGPESGGQAAFQHVPLVLGGKDVGADALVNAAGQALVPDTLLETLGAKREAIGEIDRVYWHLNGQDGDYTLGRTAATLGGKAFSLAVPALRRNGIIYVDAAFVARMAGVDLVQTPDRISLSRKIEGMNDIAGHWAQASIAQLLRAGIVSGNGDSTFRPDGTLTRAAFVKMLMGAQSVPLRPGATGGFVDTAEHWSARQGYLGAAVGTGVLVVSEYPGGRFEPERPITREEMAVMVTRSLGLDAKAALRVVSTLGGRANIAGKTFVDADTWGRPGYIALAIEEGIINGYQEGSNQYAYRPERQATRAEAVVMVVRTLGR